MHRTVKANNRILIVDDNQAIHDDFHKILVSKVDGSSLDAQAMMLFDEPATVENALNYELDSAFQGEEAALKVSEAVHAGNPYAMAFVDMRMPPGWDGVVTIQHLWEVDPELNIVICTAYSDYTSKQIINELGESDQLLILKKPFEAEEVRLVAVAMTKKWQQAKQAQLHMADLEDAIALRTQEVVLARDMVALGLAKLADSRDRETGDHLERMRDYSQIIAEELASDSEYSDQIDAQFLNDLYRSSPLHDIGKVGIPDAILCKPGKLTDEEFDTMRQHVRIGADTLRDIMKYDGSGSFMAMAADIVEFHHERFNGTGYLQGLAGKAIPLSARIVAVADVFDAITSKRVYKDAETPEKTKKIIIEESGKHFDPVVVDAFLRGYDRILNAMESKVSLKSRESSTQSISEQTEATEVSGELVAAE